MGWYQVYCVIAGNGGPDKILPETRRVILAGEADPPRTWDLGVAAYYGEWPGDARTKCADRPDPAND